MELETNKTVETINKNKTKLLEPKNYRVILYNDHFTTKEFVVEVLMRRFNKKYDEALILMEKVHNQNQAIIGTYPYDIAATRMSLTIQDARQNGFPLRCEMEEG